MKVWRWVAWPALQALLGTCLLLTACSDSSSTPAAHHDAGASASDAGCGKAKACVDPLRRYEPEKRVDFDNVVAFGAAPKALKLPDPPKSGFRVIVAPQLLAPGEELEECRAWPYPKLKHKNVYAARLYTNGGLHHSNMYGVPLAASGPSPYPECAPGQGEVQTQTPNFFAGNIMDVLFANSTQIPNGEQLVLPEGMAFKITTDEREIATSIHWLNTRSDAFTSEIAYDFFTMPDDAVQTEVVPFVFEPEEFSIAPHTESDITSDCMLSGAPGHIVTLMAHTHKRRKHVTVELLSDGADPLTILDEGAFDTETQIHVLDQAIPLEGFTRIRHRCTVANELDKPIVWGIGDNEMCTLFGYLYPPSAQQLGFTAKGDKACTALDLGALRK